MENTKHYMYIAGVKAAMKAVSTNAVVERKAASAESNPEYVLHIAKHTVDALQDKLTGVVRKVKT